MNAKQVIALAVIAFAGNAAFAEGAATADQHYGIAKTRAEVRAEVIAARAQGQLPLGVESEVGVPQPAATVGLLSRDTVRAEVVNAVAAGLLPMGVESEVGVVLPAVASHASRDQVRNEAVFAQRTRVAVYDPAG
jgi:hypothetical protein